MHIYLDSVGMNEKINNCDGLKNCKWQFVRDEELEMLWRLKVVMQLLVHMHPSLHAFPWLLNVVNENTVECTSIFIKDREIESMHTLMVVSTLLVTGVCFCWSLVVMHFIFVCVTSCVCAHKHVSVCIDDYLIFAKHANLSVPKTFNTSFEVGV